MIKPDWWIREMAKKGMIEPFEERLVREGVISYGLSSFGYDLRAAPEWKIFTNVFSTVVDPKGFDPRSFVEYEGEEVIIPPNSFALTRSIEYIRMPENVIAIALGKSTYARCGIVANVTPLVFWMWVAGGLMALGTLYILWPARGAEAAKGVSPA